MHSSISVGHVTHFFWENRSRSQEHIMYIVKICFNSVPGGPINFNSEADILGG